MTATTRAPLGAALALLLALASLTGGAAPALVLGVTLASVLLISAGWPDLLELQSPTGTRIVMAATGVASALLGFLAPRGMPTMTTVACVCALGIFGSFVHQMARRERTGLTASLTGTVAGAMLTGLAGCWIRAQLDATDAGSGASLVTAGALGLAAALLATATPLRRPAAAALAVLASAAVTAIVATAPAVDASGLPAALLVGAVIGVGAAAVHVLLGSVLTAREALASVAIAGAPVATVGVIALLALRLLGAAGA